MSGRWGRLGKNGFIAKTDQKCGLRGLLLGIQPKHTTEILLTYRTDASLLCNILPNNLKPEKAMGKIPLLQSENLPCLKWC